MESSLTKAPTASSIETHIVAIWRYVETGIYTAASCVIAATALVALAGAGQALLQGLRDWSSWDAVVRVVDGLLLVLMLVEILHTVRISLHSHVIEAEPFLIVGLIATIRRILVIGLEAGNLSRPETWDAKHESLFRESAIELALLGCLVLILVSAIYLLRRARPSWQTGVTD